MEWVNSWLTAVLDWSYKSTNGPPPPVPDALLRGKARDETRYAFEALALNWRATRREFERWAGHPGDVQRAGTTPRTVEIGMCLCPSSRHDLRGAYDVTDYVPSNCNPPCPGIEVGLLPVRMDRKRSIAGDWYRIEAIETIKHAQGGWVLAQDWSPPLSEPEKEPT